MAYQKNMLHHRQKFMKELKRTTYSYVKLDQLILNMNTLKINLLTQLINILLQVYMAANEF